MGALWRLFSVQWNGLPVASLAVFAIGGATTQSPGPKLSAYLPGSAELNQHTMSDGPYQVSSYVPNKTIVLTPNPAWK